MEPSLREKRGRLQSKKERKGAPSKRVRRRGRGVEKCGKSEPAQPDDRKTERSKTRKSSVSMREKSTRSKRQRPHTPKPQHKSRQAERQKLTLPVSLAEWFNITVKKGVKGIREEFKELRSYTPAQFGQSAFQQNSKRNRYKDVICMDETRVKLADGLENSEGGDYIHASHVNDTGGPVHFICSQAPNDLTMNDFWRMVFQEGSRLILMLCGVSEQGKQKCSEYWPRTEKDKKLFTHFMVQNDGVEQLALPDKHSITITKLTVQNLRTGKTHQTEHYYWTAWPDKSVPANGRPVLELVDVANSLAKGKPVVVHCSAGIGRTGTLVALYMAIERVNSRQKLEMAEVVRALRNQRMHSIQTELQYLFIHRTLMEYYNDFESIPFSAELGTFLLHYRTLVDGGALPT